MSEKIVKNADRQKHPFVNVAIPLEDREKLRKIAQHEDRTMAMQLKRMIREEYEKRFGSEISD